MNEPDNNRRTAVARIFLEQQPPETPEEQRRRLGKTAGSALALSLAILLGLIIMFYFVLPSGEGGAVVSLEGTNNSWKAPRN